MRKTAVVVDDASVVWDQTVLLAPTSLALASGQIMAVTGSNGAGKTTLLRIVAGRLAPTFGTVAVAGEAPDEKDSRFRARVAALLGMPPLARNLTVREHLELVTTSWGWSLAESRDRVEALLAELTIASLARRFPHELSSGQTQLFALALTMARPFEVLLLDEPEQRLDADRMETVGTALRARVEGGASVLMASHNALLVDQVADEVLVLTESAYEPGR